MNEIQMLRPVIVAQLGPSAWTYINAGSPEIHNGYVHFWMYSHECVWGIDTSPPLLMQLETDQEFATFEDLITSLYEFPWTA